MSGDGNPARLPGMFILAMTPFGCNEVPSIILKLFLSFPELSG
jgi:hypothetical protein